MIVSWSKCWLLAKHTKIGVKTTLGYQYHKFTFLMCISPNGYRRYVVLSSASSVDIYTSIVWTMRTVLQMENKRDTDLPLGSNQFSFQSVLWWSFLLTCDTEVGLFFKVVVRDTKFVRRVKSTKHANTTA